MTEGTGTPPDQVSPAVPEPATTGSADVQQSADTETVALAKFNTGPGIDQYHGSGTLRELAEQGLPPREQALLLQYELFHAKESQCIQLQHDRDEERKEVRELRARLEASQRETGTAVGRVGVLEERIRWLEAALEQAKFASAILSALGGVLAGFTSALFTMSHAAGVALGIVAAGLLLSPLYVGKRGGKDT